MLFCFALTISSKRWRSDHGLGTFDKKFPSILAPSDLKWDCEPIVSKQCVAERQQHLFRLTPRLGES